MSKIKLQAPNILIHVYLICGSDTLGNDRGFVKVWHIVSVQVDVNVNFIREIVCQFFFNYVFARLKMNFADVKPGSMNSLGASE
jgi:hypothetical protein